MTHPARGGRGRASPRMSALVYAEAGYNACCSRQDRHVDRSARGRRDPPSRRRAQAPGPGAAPGGRWPAAVLPGRAGLAGRDQPWAHGHRRVHRSRPHILRAARDRPRSWRAWLAGLVTRRSVGVLDATRDPVASAGTGHPGIRPGLPRWRRALGVAAGVATALALAWYFVGPPWYLSQTPTSITYQEDVWLPGFQAIAGGHLPDTGAAGTQFGPGTQLACYWLMRHVTSFSVVGFRQAWAVLFWVGASVLFVAFFLAFVYFRALRGSALSALLSPPLRQVAFP